MKSKVNGEDGEWNIEYVQNLVNSLEDTVNHANYFNIFKKLETSWTKIVQNDTFKKAANIR